ncbi:MAG: ATP-grasp domain-containing protein, partial [Gemmatimonadota bacterium]
VHGLDDVRRELGPLVVEARLPRAGHAPTGTYEGEGYIIVRHPETAVVERALRTIVTRVRVDLG